MKLAEALNERADIQTRLQQLRSRLMNNAKVQEGEEPSEEPAVLLDELNSLISRLEELIARINKTNSQTICGTMTLTDMLARKDCLSRKINILQDFIYSAGNLVDRSLRSEIKIKSTVSVAQQQKQLDKLCQEYRRLDTQIQQANWNVDLI